MREDFRRTMRFWADRGVDGFRIDVAHGLRKDMSEPYPPWGEIADIMRPDGSHPLWDRDDVHEIYADWRRIFDSYDPPRFAVGEASCIRRGARGTHQPDSLGQAFNFAMQDADWRPEDYRQVINDRAGRHDQFRLDDQLAAGLPRHATGGDPVWPATGRGSAGATGRPGLAANRRRDAAAGPDRWVSGGPARRS